MKQCGKLFLGIFLANGMQAILHIWEPFAVLFLNVLIVLLWVAVSFPCALRLRRCALECWKFTDDSEGHRQARGVKVYGGDVHVAVLIKASVAGRQIYG